MDIKTTNGIFRSMVPSGASAGRHEALELRDKNTRYLGKGILKVINNINNIIAPKIIGLDCKSQEIIDSLLIKLDGTDNKGKLGANAILPVSMAITKAGASDKNLPLYSYVSEMFGIISHKMPVPLCNIINGGKHAGQDNSFQEHMIMPTGAKSFSEGLRYVSEIYHYLSKILYKKFGSSGILIGDEGGFAPSGLININDRFDYIMKAIDKAGYNELIKIAIDPASSEFYYDGIYKIGEKSFSGGEMIDIYTDLCKTYPIVSIEDGLAEDDWNSWIEITKKLGSKVQIVGDDLFVTNTKRIQKGIELNAANSVLIKLNQIGTVTETLNAIKMANDEGWSSIISHRSGETEDTFIADLVVGTSSGQIKTGAPARSDRTSKYNQLLRIEEDLGKEAEYPGIDFRIVD